MDDYVNIGGQRVKRIEYKGVPVVTFRMVDELHGRHQDTARRNWNANKGRFLEGQDFFRLSNGEIPRSVRNSSGPYQYAPTVVFLTQTGYLMLVKSLNDDLAWKIQRDMVNVYFAHRERKALKPAHEAACPMKGMVEKLLEALEGNKNVMDEAIKVMNETIAAYNGRSRNPFRKLMFPVHFVDDKDKALAKCPALCPAH